jgi:hypothetical protein
MANYRHYRIENEGQEPFIHRVKEGSRYLETWLKLMAGPVPAPALTRRSDHILKFRKAGVWIETEFRSQRSDGHEKFGLYHLRSKVTPVSGSEVAA